MKKILFGLLFFALSISYNDYTLSGHYRVINKPYNSGLDFWIFDLKDNVYSARSRYGTTFGKIEKFTVGSNTYFYLKDTLNPNMKTKLDSLILKDNLIEILNPSKDTIKFRITSSTQLSITKGTGIMVKY